MMKATAVTAFAIVGLMYIFQKHGAEIKKSNNIIEAYKKQKNVLESNITALMEEEKILKSKNVQLLSELDERSLTYQEKIKDLNQLLAQKEKRLKEEKNRAIQLLNQAKEATKKVELEYQAKSKEVEELLKQRETLEENLSLQIEKNGLLLEEKEKVTERIAQLLKISEMESINELLTEKENLEANLTLEISKENKLKEENAELQAKIAEMVSLVEMVKRDANITHNKDMEEYQILLSKYKSLEENLSNEIAQKNVLIEEKIALEAKIEDEVQKRNLLEANLTSEIEKENSLRAELEKELEKEKSLYLDLNKTLEERELCIQSNKKMELQMAELLIISKDSREKAEIEHQKEIEALELRLAEELEREKKLEENLTLEIEQENLLVQKVEELKAKLTEQLEMAKHEKEEALKEYKNKINELQLILAQEVENKEQLESNLTSELEKERVLIEEKKLLEEKIVEQVALINQEIEKEKSLKAKLASEIEKENLLVEEKKRLEIEIAELTATIEQKNKEIESKDKIHQEDIAVIEELTQKRDELQKIADERAIQIDKEKEATQKALLEVKTVKEKMEEILRNIEEEKRAEEERKRREKEVAKAKLLEAFKSTRVEFEVNSVKLTKKSEELLNHTAEVMKKYPDFHYNIQGHTDNRGNEDFNIKLSAKRAEEVKKYLISRGIREEILTTEGIGSAQPIADNNTEEGRILNRRVVFQIVEE